MTELPKLTPQARIDMEKDIRAAIVVVREKDNKIPSEVLDFMLTASLRALKNL